MPKPMKTRATTNTIGKKFHEVMEEKGMPGDYKALAAVFGVKTPSVYDWIDHARIGKDKYPKLVEWSGRSLHWWFDIAAPVPEFGPPAVAQETARVHEIKPRITWPFTRPFDAFNRLSDSDKERIDGYITGLIDARDGNGASRREQHAGAGQPP